jgi:hypothetical protein
MGCQRAPLLNMSSRVVGWAGKRGAIPPLTSLPGTAELAKPTATHLYAVARRLFSMPSGASRSWSRIMNRKSRTVSLVSLRFLLFAGCVLMQSACQPPTAAPPAPVAAPVPVAEPAAPPPAVQLADGTWTVQGTRIPGSRFCGEWLVRLTNAGGELSGFVTHARVTVPIENLVLMPDGSFSGTTPAKMSGSRRAPPSTITGRFSGDTVSVIFGSERCPSRQATGIRRPIGV